MLVLTAEQVRRALPMEACIAAMKAAFAALSAGRAQVPLRARLSVPPHEAVSLIMPAFVDTGDDQAMAIKIVSLFPHNPARDLAFIQAAVLVCEPESGRPTALLEGSALTAIRTGAASGAAIDLLARPDSKVVAVFGAGVQGRTQLQAACAARAVERARVYDPSRARAEAFAREMAPVLSLPEPIMVAETPGQAAGGADIICTATTSKTPVFEDRHVRPGTHISAVGSYAPDMQELPAETVSRANLVVDSRSAALAESGDLIQPIQAGLFTEAHIRAELGEIISGRLPGRVSPEEITIFKSVGVAVQDAVAAQLALRNARAWGLGTEVPF